MKASRAVFLSLFVLLLSTTQMALTQDLIEPLEIGADVPVTIHQLDQTAYFSFNISYLEPNSDLFVLVSQRTFFLNKVFLFLSTTTQYPSAENNEIQAISTYDNTIYIPAAKLQVGTTYYLGVQCQTDNGCNFDLQIQYAKELFLKAQVPSVTINFENNNETVVRAEIPYDESIDRIVFYAENNKPYDLPITLLANQGNDVPTVEGFQFEGHNSWQSGKAFSVEKGDLLFCIGCNYTFLISGPYYDEIVFGKKTYGHLLDLTVGHTTYDSVVKGHNNTYFVDIFDDKLENDSITIDFTAYDGLAAIYVDANRIPERTDQYYWQLGSHSTQRLTITGEERKKYDTEIGNIKFLVITIDGTHSANYKLKVDTTTRYNNYIKVGQHESGWAEPKEHVQYKLVSTAGAYMKMNIQLNHVAGSVPYLFVKKCDSISKCHFMDSEIAALLAGTIKPTKEDPLMLMSNKNGDQNIDISMEANVCKKQGSHGKYECMFAISVVNEHKSRADYDLIANTFGLHTKLTLNKPYMGHITSGMKHYFSFSAPNDDMIENVNFQLTEISGQSKMIVSKNDKYPSAFSTDKKVDVSRITYSRVSDGQDVFGKFYISVDVSYTATFTLTATIDFNYDSVKIIPLSDGVKYSDVFTPAKPIYFKLTPHYLDMNYKQFEFEVKLESGIYQVCVRSDGQLPSPGNCQWNSTHQNLVIKADEENTQYLVGIFKADDANLAKSKYPLDITYFTMHHSIQVGPGSYQGYEIHSEKAYYFKMQADIMSDSEIFISTKTYPQNKQLQIYVSRQSTYLTNLSNPDVEIQGINSVRIEKAQLKDMCSDHEYPNNLCYIRFAITTDSPSTVRFNMIIQTDYKYIHLQEGIEQTYSFPDSENNHPIYVSYEPPSTDELEIIVRSWTESLDLYAKFVDTRYSTNTYYWSYPSEENHDFKSHKDEDDRRIFETSLVIPADRMDVACHEQHCGVSITLNHVPFTNSANNFMRKFTILATQLIKPINLGRQVQVKAEQGQYKYFSLYVDQPDRTIFVSMTVISSGDAQLMLEQGADARPTLDTAPFVTFSGNSETIQVAQADNNGKSMKGDWVIGVFAHDYCEFTVTAIYDDHEFLSVTEGIPNQISLKKGQLVYFRFFNHHSSGYVIRAVREYGAAVAYINTIKTGQDFIKMRPNETSYEVSKHFKYNRNSYSFSSGQKGYCAQCLIVMAIEATEDTKLTISFTSQDTFLTLQFLEPLHDYNPAGLENLYKFTSNSNYVDIDLVVYSGKPQIYVAHDNKVSTEHYIWKFDGSFKNNFINMRLNNTDFLAAGSGTVEYNGSTIDPFDYYVLVTGDSNSNFTIQTSQPNSTIMMYDGMMVRGLLNDGEVDFYNYMSGSQPSNNTIKLTFTLFRDEISQVLADTNVFPGILIIHFDPDLSLPNGEIIIPTTEDKIQFPEGSPYISMQQIQFPRLAGRYIFIVRDDYSGDVSTHLNFSLVVNNFDPFFLPMNTDFHSRLPVGHQDRYAFHIDHPGTLVLELFECFGEIGLMASPDPDIFLGEKAQLHDLDFIENYKFARINVNFTGTLYVIIQTWWGVEDTANPNIVEAMYKIRARFYETGAMLPYPYIKAGNGGKTSWTQNDKNLDIKFTGLSLDQAVLDKLSGVTYYYEAFLAHSFRVAHSLAQCHLAPEQSGAFANTDMTYDYIKTESTSQMSGEEVSMSIPENHVSDDGFIVVKATVQGTETGTNSDWEYPVFYVITPTRGDGSSTDGNIDDGSNGFFDGDHTILYIVGGSLAFIVLVLLGCRWYKQRKAANDPLRYNADTSSDVEKGSTETKSSSSSSKSSSNKQSALDMYTEMSDYKKV